MPLFSVTYELINEESAKNGDAFERGFVLQNARLRDAWQEVGQFCTEDSGSWFINHEYNIGTREHFEQGIVETRSLHPPRNITPSSYDRLKRLFNC